MYRVELNYPCGITIWKDFATGAKALEFYQCVKKESSGNVVVFVFDLVSQKIEPALLAECCMKWDLADKLRKENEMMVEPKH